MVDANEEQNQKTGTGSSGATPMAGMTGSDLAYVGCALVGDVFRIMARSNLKASDEHIDALLDEAGSDDE